MRRSLNVVLLALSVVLIGEVSWWYFRDNPAPPIAARADGAALVLDSLTAKVGSRVKVSVKYGTVDFSGWSPRVDFQRWSGAAHQWKTTYVIYSEADSNAEPRVYPADKLPMDNLELDLGGGFQWIRVPDVSPGVYRLKEQIVFRDLNRSSASDDSNFAFAALHVTR